MINSFSSIIELISTFTDEQTCINHLEHLRWGDNVISPFDNESKVYKCKNNRYKCKNTGKYFNVKTNTIFHNSHVPLRKWFLAIWLITSHKKGISSLQLSRDLKVTQKTAWFMLHRIRGCFGLDGIIMLTGNVEIDETYVGGKNKNRHEHKKIQGTQGRSVKDKTPVVGMVERNGLLAASKVETTTKTELLSEALKRIETESTVYSDEWKGYNDFNDYYYHSIVKHSSKEYVKGQVHTNTIEGFWALLKRGIYGIYHFASSKHLQAYVDEYVFRYNTRTDGEGYRFNKFLMGIQNKRLTYKELIND